MLIEKEISPGKNELLQSLEDDQVCPVGTKNECLNFLVSFFNSVRPSDLKDRKEAEENLQQAIQFIEVHPFIARKLRHAILVQLVNSDLESSLTESGIPVGSNFWHELISRIDHKILPPEQNKDDFLYVLNRIFHEKYDYVWVKGIKRTTWISFFELLQFTLRASDPSLQEHILSALRVLSFKVANIGLEDEIRDFTSVSGTTQESPFTRQSRKVYDLTQQAKSSPDNIQEACNRLKSILFEIEDEIDYITRHKAARGTSIRQSYLLLMAGARVRRMLLLIDMIDNDESFEMGQFVDMFKILVRNENLKYSIREFASQTFSYVAYQIAEHKGEKGSKYITATHKEYFHMIVSAMWGGLIICFVAVFKNLLGRLHYAHFWQGFWYSINYSVGFVAIDQSGSTLATKQPAFTANAVAVSLDSKKNNGSPDLNNLALTVASVVRSQTASFIGNLAIVFPGTYLLAWIYDLIFHEKISSGRAAVQLLQDQHPFQSMSLLYACNTGVFLFLSGLIAGYVQNKVRFGRVGKRIGELGSPDQGQKKKGVLWLAKFIEKNAGSYAGNISLGFFLGMAAPLGKIFGVPFDIRHITISSGNMAIGVYGVGIHNIPFNYFITVFLGVLGVGFFNFLISFSLAFIVAVKSRGIRLKQYPQLLSILGAHLKAKPLSFIFPPKNAG